jgi:hypothetical protein
VTRLEALGRLGGAIATIAFFALFQGLVSHAFTASNMVGTARAGDGTGTVSGYELGPPNFRLDERDPRLVAAVSFRLDSVPPSGSTLRARLSDGGVWLECSSMGSEVTCPASEQRIGVEGADRLTVVISQ